MTVKQRWLVACLEGVARNDLDRGATPRLATELLSDRALPSLQWRAGGACIDHWLELLDTARLRRAGMDVDLRSLLLAPSWRSDDSTLHQLERRPGGPANLTCIRLREQARQGMRVGLGTRAHLNSLSRMESYLDRARAILEEEGVALSCLVLSYAPLTPIQRCFDAKRHLLDKLPRVARRELDLCQTPAFLRVRFSANKAMHQVVATLSQEPASNHCRILGSREAAAAGFVNSAQECLFVPKAGAAFHHIALRAAPSILYTDERCPCALVPFAASNRSTASIVEVAQQLVAEIHPNPEVRLAPQHAASPVIDLQASYPDLEALFA